MFMCAVPPTRRSIDAYCHLLPLPPLLPSRPRSLAAHDRLAQHRRTAAQPDASHGRTLLWPLAAPRKPDRPLGTRGSEHAGRPEKVQLPNVARPQVDGAGKNVSVPRFRHAGHAPVQAGQRGLERRHVGLAFSWRAFLLTLRVPRQEQARNGLPGDGESANVRGRGSSDTAVQAFFLLESCGLCRRRARRRISASTVMIAIAS